MKVKAFIFSVFFAAIMLLSACGDGSDGRIILEFDGGGGSGDYNSTISMVQSSANPYPYNTLEKLAEEWNKSNDKFKVVINKNSLRGMRSAVTSLLEAGNAPDMLFQVGSVINDDIANGWYVPLDTYLQKPNPYMQGNTQWADIYDSRELATTRASDGSHYYVCLDRVALGLLYNIEILNQAGIQDIPVTFSEFIECLETLKQAKANGTIQAEVFAHQGLWTELHLNASVYAGKIAEWDLDGDRMVSSYELAKAYKEGGWSYNDGEFEEFLRLCYEKGKYYPDNYLAYDVSYNFSRGRLAVTDGLGNNMRIAQSGLKDKLVVGGYPALDSAASEYASASVMRGSAGLSTAYWVTNSAKNKGQDAVDACVDFLMFLSAPQNNSRMVGDLGFAMPLNMQDNNVSLFDNLASQYLEDLNAGNSVMWGAVDTYSSFGLELSDYYQRAMGGFYQGPNEGDPSYIVAVMNNNIDSALNKLIANNNWDI